MSKYVVPDKYDKRICPFDPLHQIDAKRFQRHLLKCRKQYPHVKKVHCPFNHTHVIDAATLQHHLSTCPDKVRIDQDVGRGETEPRRMKGNIPPPPVADFQMVETENWDDDDDTSGIPPNFIALQHAQSGPASVVNQFKKLSGFANETRPQPAEPRMPRDMPQIMKMTGVTADPKQAMALAGIGRGKPASSTMSVASGSNTGPVSSVPIGRGSAFTGHDIQNMSIGRGSWIASSEVSTNHVSTGPGGLAGRAPMSGVAPPTSQLQALPGVARGRGRGRGMSTARQVGGGINGSVGTPSPASSEASDNQSARDAAVNAFFDPDMTITFVTPNVNKQTPPGGSGGQERNEDDPEAEAKYIRKLRKKLRDINRLEEKSNEGLELSSEEKKKIAMKDEVIEQLEALTLDDSE